MKRKYREFSTKSLNMVPVISHNLYSYIKRIIVLMMNVYNNSHTLYQNHIENVCMNIGKTYFCKIEY